MFKYAFLSLSLLFLLTLEQNHIRRIASLFPQIKDHLPRKPVNLTVN